MNFRIALISNWRVLSWSYITTTRRSALTWTNLIAFSIKIHVTVTLKQNTVARIVVKWQVNKERTRPSSQILVRAGSLCSQSNSRLHLTTLAISNSDELATNTCNWHVITSDMLARSAWRRNMTNTRQQEPSYYDHGCKHKANSNLSNIFNVKYRSHRNSSTEYLNRIAIGCIGHRWRD